MNISLDHKGCLRFSVKLGWVQWLCESWTGETETWVGKVLAVGLITHPVVSEPGYEPHSSVWGGLDSDRPEVKVRQGWYLRAFYSSPQAWGETAPETGTSADARVALKGWAQTPG